MTNQTLRIGDTGNDVITLQKALSARGFDPGAADGIFGNRTLKAVKSFQQATGLVVDGIVGPITWSALGHVQSSSGRLLDAPHILQLPELPRGCEVTSLAMMLNYAGIHVDKMTLASQINKVPYWEDGFHGNPYKGFVGDMYDFNQPGYGVYHGPIYELASQYMPDRVTDLTGSDFSSVVNGITRGTPVWIITNTRFKQLDPNSFETWYTKSGTVKITWHEHSVLVTGYDANYIYINDPLDSYGKNKKLAKKKFIEAWEQMGKQAITYLMI